MSETEKQIQRMESERALMTPDQLRARVAILETGILHALWGGPRLRTPEEYLLEAIQAGDAGETQEHFDLRKHMEMTDKLWATLGFQ